MKQEELFEVFVRRCQRLVEMHRDVQERSRELQEAMGHLQDGLKEVRGMVYEILRRM